MKTLLLACSIICLSLGCATISNLWTDEDLYSYPYDCSVYPDDCPNYPYPWYGLYPDDLWYYDCFMLVSNQENIDKNSHIGKILKLTKVILRTGKLTKLKT